MLRIHQMERAKEGCTAEDLMDACKQYFSMRCEQLSCFEELRGAVAALDTDSQRNFVDCAVTAVNINSVSEASSVVQVLNALKLEYCFLISREPTERAVQDFSIKAVDTYRQFCCTDRKSDNPVVQLAMLACMTLLRVNKKKQKSVIDRTFQPTSYVQAGFLLSYCLSRCKDDYPTLVMLILTSTLLGTISLAAASFRKLSVKNLQWENAGYLLLTRLSTLHPHRSKGREEVFDPLQMLDLAIVANENSVRSIRRHIMAGLDHKSYVNVLDTIELKQDLKRSFTRQLYYLESARAKRLRDFPAAERESVVSGGAKHPIYVQGYRTV
jgi:N-terminal acetyltransferase B complex non-catalytic subunit